YSINCAIAHVTSLVKAVWPPRLRDTEEDIERDMNSDGSQSLHVFSALKLLRCPRCLGGPIRFRPPGYDAIIMTTHRPLLIALMIFSFIACAYAADEPATSPEDKDRLRELDAYWATV